MRYIDSFLPAGTLVFTAGALAILRAATAGPSWLLWPGLGALLLALVAFCIAAWRAHTRLDWRRIEVEQRLWESGPVGRLWLKFRKIYAGR